MRHCACGGEDVAPCVVDVGGHFLILKAGDVPNQLHHIALQIQHIAVSLSGSGAVFVANDEIMLWTLLISLPINYYCELLDKIINKQPKKEHTYGTK